MSLWSLDHVSQVLVICLQTCLEAASTIIVAGLINVERVVGPLSPFLATPKTAVLPRMDPPQEVDNPLVQPFTFREHHQGQRGRTGKKRSDPCGHVLD